MKIYKQPLNPNDTTHVKNCFKALTVQVQKGIPCLWYIDDMQASSRLFNVVPTGDDLDEDQTNKYVGTFQLNEGCLVFHVFEI